MADDARFETTLNRTVEQICWGSPLAARFNKGLIRKFLDQAGLPSLAERRELYQLANSDDYRAGRAAFLEKRSPCLPAREGIAPRSSLLRSEH